MDSTIKKDALIAILRENRTKHRGVFEAALSGYRTRALDVLNGTVQALLEGKTPEVRLLLSRPQDHTPDYERVIKMLELDVRDEVTLTESEVAQYVMDDWRWKRDFLTLSNRYAAGPTQQAYGVVVEEEEG